MAPITGEFRVNSGTSDAWSFTMPRISRVSGSPSNRFAVAWHGKQQDPITLQWFSKTFLAIMKFTPSD